MTINTTVLDCLSVTRHHSLWLFYVIIFMQWHLNTQGLCIHITVIHMKHHLWMLYKLPIKSSFLKILNIEFEPYTIFLSKEKIQIFST